MMALGGKLLPLGVELERPAARMLAVVERRALGKLPAPAVVVSQAPPIAQAVMPRAQAAPGAGIYRCDGRTHCSQMNSCDEATYFLRNCPGTQMDGDGDGVPCERQLCD